MCCWGPPSATAAQCTRVWESRNGGKARLAEKDRESAAHQDGQLQAFPKEVHAKGFNERRLADPRAAADACPTAPR